MSPNYKLDKGEWERIAMSQPHSREYRVANIGTVEERVGNVIGFQPLLTDSGPEMESRARKAEEVVWETSIHSH